MVSNVIRTDAQLSREISKHASKDCRTSELVTPPSTPTPAATTAHRLHQKIQDIHHQLIPLERLAPCPLVDTLLTRLVALCIKPYSTDVVAHFSRIDGVRSLCQELQLLCGTAEGELERHWVQKILDTPALVADTRTILETFPYHTNYLALTHLETSLLAPFISEPQRIAFIGSGPLPLSSLQLLTRFTNATVTNIDRDGEALSLSRTLVENLGEEEERRMEFVRTDVTEVNSAVNWHSFDVVFLAALVGMSQEGKVDILRALTPKLKKGAVVVCRSAWGIRRVLYPVLEITDELLDAGFEVLAEMHPWTEVVNSVVVLRVKEVI